MSYISIFIYWKRERKGMPRGRGEEYKLGELAELSGIPARTIRHYIARGILSGPIRAGRKAAYDESHVRRLKRIGDLQRRGLTLAQIRYEFGEKTEEGALPGPSLWLNYTIAPDVTVAVRGDVSAWRMKQIREILTGLQQQLNLEEEDQ